MCRYAFWFLLFVRGLGLDMCLIRVAENSHFFHFGRLCRLLWLSQQLDVT